MQDTPFVKKYLPQDKSDIIGQDKAISDILNYISTYNSQKKKAALLFGPTGTGKTSSAHTLASKLNLEVVEINASDYRKPDQIELKVGNALKQHSLFSQGKIILVDDIDGLSGTKDRGGIKAITSLFEKSKFPIILTALNIYEKKLKSLVKKCKTIEFNQLNYNSIYSILKNICDKEKIKYTEDSLKSLSYISSGDARSAINDLESLGPEITTKNIKELSERNRKDTINIALTKIFKTTDITTALAALNNVDEDIDQQILLLDENIPLQYKNPEDIANAYNNLSKADVFRKRIRRWQYYRFLVYVNALISGGIATSKQQKYSTSPDYKKPNRILKMWISNQKQAKKKSLASKIAEKTHLSQKEVMKTIIPYLPSMFKNKNFQNNFIQEFELEAQEITWLKN
tara:strand:+ start:6406 stop:7608 length:1203 start_codon:yes stop_codon:yes gene_type:complete